MWIATSSNHGRPCTHPIPQKWPRVRAKAVAAVAADVVPAGQTLLGVLGLCAQRWVFAAQVIRVTVPPSPNRDSRGGKDSDTSDSGRLAPSAAGDLFSKHSLLNARRTTQT